MLVHAFHYSTTHQLGSGARFDVRCKKLTGEQLMHCAKRMTIHICSVCPAVGLNGSVWFPLPPCKHVQSYKHQISRTHAQTHSYTRSQSASSHHHIAMSDGKKQGLKTLHSEATAQMSAAGCFPTTLSVY